MSRKKLLTRILVLAAAALLATFALEGLQLLSQPKEYEYANSPEVQAQETRLYPDSVIYLAGCEQSGDMLVVTGSDPQVMLNAEGTGGISVVALYFSGPLPGNVPVQVYYAVDGNLSEAQSVRSTCFSGSTISAVQIPPAEYALIRVDIDGSVPLQSIGVGNMVPAKVSKAPFVRWRRVALVFPALLAVFAWLAYVHAGKRFVTSVRNGIRGIRESGKKAIFYGLLFPACAGAAVLAAWVLVGGPGGAVLTGPTVVFAAVIGLFVASLVTFRKTLQDQPEYLFLVLCLCVGFLLCFFVPHGAENSWDDGHHYTQALTSSYVDEIRLTAQDQAAIYHTNPLSWDLNGGVEEVRRIQDELYHSGAVSYSSHVSINSIPETFNGIGLFTGRVLGLRYYLIDFMGRFFGLVTYALLGFFGIRKLKSGKMIAAVSLLIPTAMFTASSFNYDSYVTGFTALGFCYYMAQWQNGGEKLTLPDAMIMIGSLCLACLTKIVYLPVLVILVLLPKEKFPSARAKWIWRGAVVAAAGAVVLSVFLPSLLQTGGSFSALSDTRGGSEISADGQIRYILTHPFDYIGTVWRFLMNEYWNPTRVHELLTNYAYHGFMPNQYIYLILLAVVTFTDKNEYDLVTSRHTWIRLISLALVLAGLVLTLTALYVGFTSVGANVISGASFRYMIPLILPALMLLGSGKLDNRMNRGTYNGLVLGVAAYVNFVSVYMAFISKYY